jgi:hypothetical protein
MFKTMQTAAVAVALGVTALASTSAVAGKFLPSTINRAPITLTNPVGVQGNIHTQGPFGSTTAPSHPSSTANAPPPTPPPPGNCDGPGGCGF